MKRRADAGVPRGVAMVMLVVPMLMAGCACMGSGGDGTGNTETPCKLLGSPSSDPAACTAAEAVDLLLRDARSREADGSFLRDEVSWTERTELWLRASRGLGAMIRADPALADARENLTLVLDTAAQLPREPDAGSRGFMLEQFIGELELLRPWLHTGR